MKAMFESTGEAYDASNTCTETGTVIVVESECVVGLAWAWPIAVTADGGKLHDLAAAPEMSAQEIMTIVRRVLADAQISWADLQEAYMTARERGWAIQPWCEIVAREREWDENEEGWSG